MTVAAGTLVAAGAVACASHSGADQPGLPLIQCGIRLESGGGEADVHLARLSLVARQSGEPSAPRHSVIPPIGPPLPGGSLSKVVVLTTNDCSDAPVVTVEPVGAARTELVAHGRNGGIAGLFLAPSGRTLIVRGYLHGHLVGQVTLLHGYLPSPPAPTATP